MVAKITIPRSIEAALNYNEKKVQKGIADCLSAANYLDDAGKMNFYQKLYGFERLNSLNERATTKTLHVSLNFDPSENLADHSLIAIASMYMRKIGFGDQPFLVYKHQDAGHPHIHIVSTTIREDGSRINTHNIGRNQSEKARKEIERYFGLIRAERQQQLMKPYLKPIDIEKAVYGKSETKRCISSAVSFVFNQYSYTSLPEFNAALKQFNLLADRGKEDGRIFKNRGLVYRILDSSGNKLGVPIKASCISCKPTLVHLEEKFVLNETKREAFKQRTRIIIDECLNASPANIKDLELALAQKKIYTLLRQNETGRLYGITFVDNQNKSVFNGSDLGRAYSIAAIQTRLGSRTENKLVEEQKKKEISSGSIHMETGQHKQKEKTIIETKKTEALLDLLLNTKEQYTNTPYYLLKKKKKKKKKKPDC